ncbi:uncharacterized protein LOC111910055 [Lactuca sativa]|uniref:uncharacterized protein LOC111910055 n=1 Tax=Lactuca sativa TaxID=4236 RepID=UPI000CD96DD6|nr:uncharacterized protein LOC111910055 [Lactuca sativa]
MKQKQKTALPSTSLSISSHVKLNTPEQKKFMEKVLSFSTNASFLKSMAKLPKFIKEVMTNRMDLGKASIIMLNELCSTAIIEGLPIKIGDLGRLTLPCEFGNSTLINSLCKLGASINLMPYSFYKKVTLPRLQNTRMKIRMANQSITHPRGIVKDLVVKLGKIIFPVDFVVLDMKEDDGLPIILGRPFLSTTRALVDIHDSKPTLQVEDKEITFEMNQRVIHD